MSPADRHSAVAEPAGPLRRLAPLLIAMSIAAACAVAFGWGTLDAGFIMGDDQRLVTEHYLVNHPSLVNAWTLLRVPHGDLYQPLPMLTFQANWAMAAADGESVVSPRVFHTTNVAIHAINAMLVVLLGASIGRRTIVGALTGILFATHPMAMETVGWVSGRMILLATLFAIIMLLLAVRRPRAPGMIWPVGVWIAWLAASASKVLPTLPLVAWMFDRTSHARDSRRSTTVYLLLLALGFLAAAALARMSFSQGFTPATHGGLADEAKTALLAAGRYVDQYVVPTTLSPWTPPLEEVSWNDARVYFAALKVAAIAMATVLLRRRAPVIALGLGAFLLLLAPFLAASFSRRLFVADRYMYLPMIGLHLAVVCAIVALGERIAAARSRQSATADTAIFTAVPIAVLAAWWLWIGIGLAPVWRDTVAYAERVVAVFPDDSAAHNELARANLFQNKPADALRVATAALARWPDDARLWAQRGEAHRSLGELPEALHAFDETLKTAPNHTRTRYLRALTLADLGDSPTAVAALESLIEDQPEFLPAYRALTGLYRSTGDADRLRRLLDRAVAINPHHRDNLFDLAMLDYSQGRLDAAAKGFRRIVAIDENDDPALLNLGAVLAAQGRHLDAVKCYDRLLTRRPDEMAARFNRGDLLLMMGQHAAAESDFRAILKVQPANLDAAVRVHEILTQLQRWEALRSFWHGVPFDAAGRAEANCYEQWSSMLVAFARHDAPASRPANNPGECDGWIAVYTNLRQREWEALLSSLDSVSSEPPGDSAMIDRRRRVILGAFAALPDDLRNSRPGLLVLARLLDYLGDAEKARMVASQLTAGEDAWAREAKELLSSTAPRP